MGSNTPGSGFQTRAGRTDYVNLPDRYNWLGDTTYARPTLKRSWGDTGGFLGDQGLRRQLFGAVNKTFSQWRRANKTNGKNYWITNTVEYFFDTTTTATVTDTTFGASGRSDSNTITITIPELARQFLSVRLVATYHSVYTVTTGETGFRQGIKLGAVAVEDMDRTHASTAVAGRSMYQDVMYECTDYFNKNFGAGTTQTCQGSFAATSSVASNINGITQKLVITYAYDPDRQAGGTTRVKTIRIPIQSIITTLTTAQQEIGVDGTNPAPSNQIPALDTFLPESSKSYKTIAIESEASDGNTAVTTYTPFYQLDGAAEVARAAVAQANWTSNLIPWRDIVVVNSLDTSVVHSLSWRCDLTARLLFINSTVVVTYTYDDSAGTLRMYEAMLPLSVPSGEVSTVVVTQGISAGSDYTLLQAELNVQEPGPITLVQSAAYLDLHSKSTGQALRVKAGDQVDRTYTTIINNSYGPTIHRTDFGGGWALTRGRNKLTVAYASSTLSGPRIVVTGYALVNYTAGIPAGGSARGNRVVNFYGHGYEETQAVTIDVKTGQHQIQLGDRYRISGAMIELRQLVTETNANSQVYLEQHTGEWSGTAFTVADRTYEGVATSQISTRRLIGTTAFFNTDSLHKGRLDIEVQRRIAVANSAGTTMCVGWSWWVTYHQIQFTVAGTVTIDGANPGRDKTIKIYADDPDVTSSGSELVTTTVTNDTGAFSALVLDNTRQYYAVYDDGTRSGKSLLGTPA